MAETQETKPSVDPVGPSGVSESGPTRMCAVTRAELPPGELIRFVRAPTGEIVPDLEMRLPGRGVWLTCDRKIVEKAIKTKAKKGFIKVTAAFHGSVALPIAVNTSVIEY